MIAIIKMMTESKLNPFGDNEEEYVDSADGDVVDRELASKRQEQNASKTNTDVSDHAHVPL